nr:RNA polymerase II-associated protein 3-like isoform X2 [Aedes albopictus]
MNKFAEDQLVSEKQQVLSGSVIPKEVNEAEHYNHKGNELCRMAKGGADASSYNEKFDLDAIEMYTQAIELNSQKPDYYVNRAYCYFKLERYEECISDCNSAMQLDATCIKAYYRRMLAYEYMGNSATAYLECQNILKMAKESGDIARTKQDMQRIEGRLRTEADKHKDLGNKCLASKDYQQACDCFTKAVSVFPYEPIYYNNRALAYYHLKEYDNCLDDCNKAIELDDNYFRPYYRRACVQEHRANYQAAIVDLKKFLELVKDDKQRQTAEKDLERLQRLIHDEKNPQSHNWIELRKNTSVVNFIQKAPHLRSKKPLKRIAISEVSSSVDPKTNPSSYVIASNYEAIPDSVIDKIFNNNTGERLVEPKIENNLENLFPSSSMSKLKQLFSPPTTPSSPPSEPFGKPMASCENKLVGNNGGKAKSHSEVLSIDGAITDKTISEPKDRTNKSQPAEQVKQEKDKINQGNCPSVSGQGIECKSGDTSQPQSVQSANTQPKMASEENQNDQSNAKPAGMSGTTNPHPPIPSSSVKFYHSWCNLKTQEEKYQYLKTLENASLHKLLGANMGSDMLSDILQVLRQFCLQDKTSPMKILNEVAKNKESGILIMMLGERDKHALIQLLELMDELDDDKDQIFTIKKSLII